MTLDLRLDPRLKPSLSEAFLREARRAGVPLADIELLSFDADVVRGFLEAVRERQAHAYLAQVDRAALEGARHPPPAPAAGSGEAPRRVTR